jgi:signal transduction histidine kinase/CheY-like chemotaxis protein
MKKWDINIRVLLVALVPAFTLALLLSFYFGYSRLTDLERSLADRGLAIARHLAPATEFGVFSGNREVLSRLATAVAQEMDVTAVTIRDGLGNVLASSGDSEIPLVHPISARQPIQSEQDDGRVLVSSAPILQSQIELEEFMDVALSDAAGAPPTPPRVLGQAYVAMSRAALTAQRARVFFETLAITLLILVANVYLAVRMSRNVSRPLVKLTRAVQKLADGDLDARVVPDSDGVVRGLEDGVNTMAAALKSAHADLERRIAEATAQLEEKKEEAERANRAKSRFLAAASHDLRQPLHALGLFVASLQNKPLPGESRRIVSQIERSVLAMQDLLEALLDISRLDAGVIVPAVVDFPIYKLLSAMELNYVPAAERKGITFRAVPCSLVVRTDPILLERILLNLVSNAVRYTERGKVLLGCRRVGTDLRVEVWDTGIGIAPDQQQHIFEEFYQVAGPRQDVETGLGLGLAIVDRLAKLLGHKVAMRSIRGKGSAFGVYVPLVTGEAPLAEVPLEKAETGDLSGVSVLVVDDDPAALKATKTLLESWGCTVLAAGSGAEMHWYVLTARERPPQMIICDYRLSKEETGVQVLNHLRNTFAVDIPAILVSADTSADLMHEAQASGYPLLHKPLRPAKLRALTLHLLARSRDKSN